MVEGEPQQNISQQIHALYTEDQRVRNEYEDISMIDGKSYDFLQTVNIQDLKTLEKTDLNNLTTLLVHALEEPLDSDKDFSQKLLALEPLINELWDYEAPFGKNHLGRNILNRISAVAWYKTQSSVFLNYEQESLNRDDAAYFIGNKNAPHQQAPTIKKADMKQLVKEVTEHYKNV